MHRSIVQIVLTVPLAFLLSGCASLYVHDAGVEKATAGAKADFEKLKLSELFDNEAAYLDTLEKDEIAAVRAAGGAQRDAQILLFLHGNDTEDGRGLLASRIDRYLTTLVGSSDRVRPAKIWRAMDPAWNASAPVAALTTSLAALPVGDTNATPLPLPSGNTVAKALSDAGACGLAAAEAAGKAAQKTFEGALDAATKALTPGRTLEGALGAIVAEWSARAADANPYVRKYVSEALATRIRQLIEATGPASADEPVLTTDARAGLGFLQAVAGVGDAFSEPPRVPHPNALAAAQAWLAYVRDSANLDITEARGVCEINDAKLVAVATQAYFLSKAGEAFQGISAWSDTPAKGMMDSLAVQGHARHAAALALAYYAEAWNRGFVRYREITRLGYIRERRAKLERSRLAGAAWVGTLKPGVETLAHYGAGGIDPHAIANLLAAMGLGAVAGQAFR